MSTNLNPGTATTAPASAPASTPATAGESLMDKLKANKLYIGIAVLVISAITGAGIYFGSSEDTPDKTTKPGGSGKMTEGERSADKPVDAVWGPWGVCTESTEMGSNGKKKWKRRRSCAQAPKNGGKTCSQLDGGKAEEVCAPIDGYWQLSPDAPCERKRDASGKPVVKDGREVWGKRQTCIEPKYGGADNCNIDDLFVLDKECEYTDGFWPEKEFDDPSVVCELKRDTMTGKPVIVDGRQVYEKTITCTPPEYGGKPCKDISLKTPGAVLSEDKTVASLKCDYQDGKWGNWSTCDASGKKKRTCVLPVNGGKECTAEYPQFNLVRNADSKYKVSASSEYWSATMYGKDLSKDTPAKEIRRLLGKNVYLIEDGKYTKMVADNGEGRYYEGIIDQFDNVNWNSYTNADYLYLLKDIVEYTAFQAFDGKNDTFWHSNERSDANVFDSTTGNYKGATIVTAADGKQSWRGEWLQIEFPSDKIHTRFKPIGFKITPRQTPGDIFKYRSPRKFVLLGSNVTAGVPKEADFNWEILFDNTGTMSTGVIDWTAATKTFDITTSPDSGYRFYRLVVTQVGNHNSSPSSYKLTSVQISEFRIIGTPFYTIDSDNRTTTETIPCTIDCRVGEWKTDCVFEGNRWVQKRPTIPPVFNGSDCTETLKKPCPPDETELRPNQRLLPGDSITSSNKDYTLTYQTDGNLQINKTSDSLGKRGWNAKLKSTPGFAIFQDDGNFVVYDASNKAVFDGQSSGAAVLKLQDDGKLNAYKPDRTTVVKQVADGNQLMCSIM